MSNLSRTNTLARAESAPLARVSPLSDLNEFRRGMDEMFSRWFGEAAPGSFAQGGAFQPAVDLWETPEAYVMNVTLPGVSQEDLELEVSGDTLTIRGERKPAPRAENAVYHIQNIGYGRFSVAYTLPVPINAQGVTADYRDGILEVRLPKVETAKTRTIKVNVDSRK